LADWDSLSGQQKAAVRHDDGPAAVYAGPGSGKTRVVTLRAARMASQGKRLLVTTFTNDATEEMKGRIASMLTKDALALTHITTLHALCLQILKAQNIKFTLMTDEFQRRSLAEVAQAAELEIGVKGFLSQQSYQKNCGVTAKAYKHDGTFEDMEFARVWKAYEKAKQAKDLREFDDLILDARALIDADETLRKQLASRYTHIIVDECQDMNLPQYQIAFALARDHKNLMLVGDLDQSLYGFRGADTATFRHFASHPTTAVYELSENYRCTQSVLKFADALIRQDEKRRVLKFAPTRDMGEPVQWNRYPDPDLEAIAVGEQILRLNKRGAAFRDMAVLYRTNAQSEAFQRHFSALEIPFTIRDDGDFYARKEIQGMLAYLNFFHHLPETTQGGNHDSNAKHFPDEWLLALLNVPNRKLSKMTGAQLKNFADVRGRRIWDVLPDFHAPDLKTHRALRILAQELKDIADRLKHIEHAGDAVKIIRNATDFDGWLRRDEQDERDNDRQQNILRMQSAAAHYPTIADYLKAIQKMRDEAQRRKAERARKRRERDEVTLATGHSAKGLEWNTVFAVGWSEEILPHRKAEDIDEERRIAYVIATRARDRLFLSSLETWNDATVASSRFLNGLTLLLHTPDPQAEESTEETPLHPQAAAFDPLGGLFMG
jgi:DNA helicase II / ATP-dependent DNA helicase PcrA